jgi:hypothetical protein
VSKPVGSATAADNSSLLQEAVNWHLTWDRIPENLRTARQTGDGLSLSADEGNEHMFSHGKATLETGRTTMQMETASVPLLSQNGYKISAALLDALGGSFDFGPLTVKYSINIVTETVTVEVDLIGIKVGNLLLSASQPNAGLDFDIGIASVHGSLSVDFDRKALDGDFKACYFSNCKAYQGTIFSWNAVEGPGLLPKKRPPIPLPPASTNRQDLPLTTSTDTIKECNLQDDIGVGDCSQLRGSRVALQLSEILPGTATAVWQATTLTRHHQVAYHDTWHQRFEFKTGGGGLVAKIGWDGPDMSEDNRHYDFIRQGIVNFDPNQWDQIEIVTWSYEC